MPFIFVGLVVLALLILLGRGYTMTDAKKLANGSRFMGGILLALLTIVFVITDRFLFAMFSATASWVLLVGTVPPWNRPDFGLGTKRGGQAGSASTPPTTTAMSRAEALKVLGLKEGTSEDDIRAAHRRLILQIHPDKGGTNYLAAKINEAKDVLLGR